MAAYAEGLNLLQRADAGLDERASRRGDRTARAPGALPLRARPRCHRRGLAARQRRLLVAARPDCRGARTSRPISTASRVGSPTPARGAGRRSRRSRRERRRRCSSTALYSRFASRGEDDFANRVLSAMRAPVRRPRREARVTLALEVARGRDAAAQRVAALVGRACADGDRGARRVHARAEQGAARRMLDALSAAGLAVGPSSPCTRWTSASRRRPPRPQPHALLAALCPAGVAAPDAGDDADLEARRSRYADELPAGSISSTSAWAPTATPPRSSRTTRCSTSATAPSPSPAVRGPPADDAHLPGPRRRARGVWLVTGAEKRDALAASARPRPDDPGRPRRRRRASSSSPTPSRRVSPSTSPVRPRRSSRRGARAPRGGACRRRARGPRPAIRSFAEWTSFVASSASIALSGKKP